MAKKLGSCPCLQWRKRQESDESEEGCQCWQHSLTPAMCHDLFQVSQVSMSAMTPPMSPQRKLLSKDSPEPPGSRNVIAFFDLQGSVWLAWFKQANKLVDLTTGFWTNQYHQSREPAYHTTSGLVGLRSRKEQEQPLRNRLDSLTSTTSAPTCRTMHLLIAIVAFSLLSTAAAADWWDDFSNNLATDLAPFIALLGERATQQFLSESVSMWDYVIFAAAPLGIVTTIVSVIRVCGGPSLRAFVGRAQEGQRQVEAELCSSTSADVCELYTNGGITRVFGRPKILELVLVPSETDFESSYEFPSRPGQGGRLRVRYAKSSIYTFEEFESSTRGDADREWTFQRSRIQLRLWIRLTLLSLPLPNLRRLWGDGETSPNKHNYAPYPNLTLNFWMYQSGPALLPALALVGVVVQSGVVVVALIVTYYLRLEKGDGPAADYAAPLMTIGTFLLSTGTFLSVYLIGESTHEIKFRRATNPKTNLVVLQPGPQVIGDQTFEPFAYNENGKSKAYVSSFRDNISRGWDLIVTPAICMTSVGFILQFVGLRALHSSIAVAQLAATIVMSAVRAALRAKRRSPEENLLRRYAGDDAVARIAGHELDWLAFYINENKSVFLYTHDIFAAGSVNFLAPARQQVHLLPPSSPSSSPRPSWASADVAPRVLGFIVDVGPSVKISDEQKIVAYRARLARLTSKRFGTDTEFLGALPVPATLPPLQSADWDDKVAARDISYQLASAIQQTSDILFLGETEFHGAWKYIRYFRWEIPAAIRSSWFFSSGVNQVTSLQMCKANYKEPWCLDVSQIEAVLSLWLWDAENLSHFAPKVPLKNERIICDSPGWLEKWMLPSEYFQTFDVDPAEIGSASDISYRWVFDECRGVRARYNIDSFNLRDDSNPCRLFGRCALSDSLSATGSSNVKKIKVTTHPMDTPLVSCLAQEMFSWFIHSVFKVVSQIGGKTTRSKQLPTYRNSVLEKIVEVFAKSELGTTKDAMYCIIPAVASASNSLSDTFLQFAQEDVIRAPQHAPPSTRGGFHYQARHPMAAEAADPEQIACRRRHCVARNVKALEQAGHFYNGKDGIAAPAVRQFYTRYLIEAFGMDPLEAERLASPWAMVGAPDSRLKDDIASGNVDFVLCHLALVVLSKEALLSHSFGATDTKHISGALRQFRDSNDDKWVSAIEIMAQLCDPDDLGKDDLDGVRFEELQSKEIPGEPLSRNPVNLAADLGLLLPLTTLLRRLWGNDGERDYVHALEIAVYRNHAHIIEALLSTLPSVAVKTDFLRDWALRNGNMACLYHISAVSFASGYDPIDYEAISDRAAAMHLEQCFPRPREEQQ